MWTNYRSTRGTALHPKHLNSDRQVGLVATAFGWIISRNFPECGLTPETSSYRKLMHWFRNNSIVAFAHRRAHDSSKLKMGIDGTSLTRFTA